MYKRATQEDDWPERQEETGGLYAVAVSVPMSRVELNGSIGLRGGVSKTTNKARD